ncbi:uncharacterized protein LOC124483548 [Hypomesus transpacificus]|uniref:uncharacterized protein LOC124483548 n=1 Tax=Hypomesus transpacificus TaxID=137520 RepID=UPI001F07ED3A|nr:uncharacterized protein LOC124483548 [Hypomesus transpacificus]
MTISFSYCVGSSTVAGIVGAVSQAIWDCLVEEYMPVPTKQDWRYISEGFLQRWNFPNCLGSIDGKHVVIQAPHSSGSLYHNYKGTFSIVLLAVVDADCMFRVIDVGGYGRNSDGGTLGNSAFGLALKNGTLDLPENSIIPGAEPRGPLPHVRWRIVIHAGIDGGFPEGKKRSDIVMDLFSEAVAQFGVPFRVRCDWRGKQRHLSLHGCLPKINPRECLRGMSTHNQGIERLWGDVWRGVTEKTQGPT